MGLRGTDDEDDVGHNVKTQSRWYSDSPQYMVLNHLYPIPNFVIILFLLKFSRSLKWHPFNRILTKLLYACLVYRILATSWP
jgi:hypothetical protein